MKKIILILSLFAAFISCKNNNLVDETKRGLVVENAMVVSARAEASKIGADILKKCSKCLIRIAYLFKS